MSSASPSRDLVNHQYATDEFLPSLGEVIVVRLEQDLFGPGSSFIENSRNLPSRVTRHNYHHAVVSSVKLERLSLSFTVFPMPAYSMTDRTSGLSSTRWLLSQADDYQQKHIPVPYEEDPALAQPNPPFPTPARFGDPLEIGGWKSRRPSWVQAVPQVTTLKHTTTFKSFQPPIKLSKDELKRLEVYSRLFRPPVVSSSNTIPPFPPGSGDGAAGGPDVSPTVDGPMPSSWLPTHWPGESNNHDGEGPSAGTSLALQALYANDAVKQAFADFDQPSMAPDSGSDDDDYDDDDDDWEDNMDPVTFARYYAAGSPFLAKIVQDHDQKMRERLNQGIANWMDGVQAETS